MDRSRVGGGGGGVGQVRGAPRHGEMKLTFIQNYEGGSLIVRPSLCSLLCEDF